MCQPILLFILVLTCSSAWADTLQQRLAQASTDAEQVSNQLLAQQPTELHATDYLVLAKAQLRLRNKEVAMDATNKALQAAVQPYISAYAYLLKAQIYGILYRDTAMAITQLEQAEQLLLHREDPDSLTLYSDVLQSFAQAYNQLGNIPQAIPYAERSLQLATAQQDAAAELKARITLGRLTLQNNAYGQAYQYLNQALTLASELQDEEALASIHLRLGMAYRKMAAYPQALQHLQQAKNLYQQLKRLSSYTYALIYIGETYLEDASSVDQAEYYLTEALQQARQQQDPLRVGVATLGLGRLAVLQQQPQLAQQHFDNAIELFRQQNIKTYLQEASLALAELQLQNRNIVVADEIMQQLANDMPQAAIYLQLRFLELAARLFAQQQNWLQAYEHLQQASSLRQQEQAEQNAVQLNTINQGLQHTATVSQWQAELATQQQQLQQQHRNFAMLLAVLILLVFLLMLGLFWLYRRKVAGAGAMVPPNDWGLFCQRLQQSTSADISLLALTTAAALPLKLRFGEQHLHQLLQGCVLQLNSDVYAYCLHNNVLWLALINETTDTAALQLQLAQQLQLQLSKNGSTLPSQPVFTLELPLTQLLDKPWHTKELDALHEAVWLSLALCDSQASENNAILQVKLFSQRHACEWRSNMVRQDLLNAIRLGTVQLRCNDQLMPATIADNLS
uniref:Uncharacterized protein n=1 Tax=Rheinheimera sp. BAL341 TaxID=1708203 RepID=A0A486XRD1_9GAMM